MASSCRIAEKESACNYGKRYVQTVHIWEGREVRGPRAIKRRGHTVKAKPSQAKCLGPLSTWQRHRRLECRESGFKKKCWNTGGGAKQVRLLGNNSF